MVWSKNFLISWLGRETIQTIASLGMKYWSPPQGDYYSSLRYSSFARVSVLFCFLDALILTVRKPRLEREWGQKLRVAGADSEQKISFFRTLVVNQSAILSSEQPKQQSGPYLLQKIPVPIKTLPRQLKTHWTPSSGRVPRSEAADLAATKATE